jgi:hypothetical protein
VSDPTAGLQALLQCLCQLGLSSQCHNFFDSLADLTSHCIAWASWLAFGNAFELVTGILADCLHGNISIKVSYNVRHDIFRFPILESSKGKLIGITFAPLYWIVAPVLAASIPQITNFQSFVGDACALPFTSTFPPFLVVGFKRQR